MLPQLVTKPRGPRCAGWEFWAIRVADAHLFGLTEESSVARSSICEVWSNCHLRGFVQLSGVHRGITKSSTGDSLILDHDKW